MKQIIIFILSLPIFCTSCSKEVDYGFPDKVRFTKEGGELILTGETWIGRIAIRDYDGNEESDDCDWRSNEDTSITVTYGWLTVYSPHYQSSKLQLKVEPNPKSKRRKLYISLNEGLGPDYTDITVIQDK